MKEHFDLLRVLRPSRYINNEINSVHKKSIVRVALAFPDIYDVGMSHLGLKILYEIINNIPYTSAERAFSPWPDMESEMRRLNLPLCSLESQDPLRNFDVVGFSLQYELSYPTVLNMLDLSGIPIRAEERRNDDPIIMAGGPCTVNPIPMSPFIDAFLIGEGEEAIFEIINVVYQSKGDRKGILKGLAGIEGIYVPSVHGKEKDSLIKVKRRYIKDLDSAPYPLSPVVPFTSVVHDRITIEVSRGCPRGCRFCQAGMIYRPLRERSPERIMQIAEESLRRTGYEEVSLSSLSTGDYCNLIPLLKEMNKRFSERVVSISLPSLRVASVNKEVLKEIKTVRKTGFTIAPEAATERLRKVINKDFNDEDYERALHALFSEGWENLKLYFMIGLPGESDEDVEAIPEMALKAIKVAKRYSKRFVNLSVTVSPFVPKVHTPFQWLGQEPLDRITKKLDYLREKLSKKVINYKGHDPRMSLLEAVLSRGDSDISNLIEEAWKKGCRLDAWTDWFDFNRWVAASEASGIDLIKYAERKLDFDVSLPWDIIDSGIKKEFLKKELDRALSEDMTPECRERCYGCGLNCDTRYKIQDTRHILNPESCIMYPEFIAHRASPITHHALRIRDHGSRITQQRLRVQFQKTGMMKYLSHRELMTAIIRAVRRADIPVLYSQGFHPSPRLSFGPPLNVGVSGLREYFDMEVKAGLPFNIKERLNNVLPEGIKINDVFHVDKSIPSLDSFIKRYEYEIICRDVSAVSDFISKDNFVIERETANGKKLSIDLKAMVESLHIIDKDRLRLILTDQIEKVRLNEMIKAMFGGSDQEMPYSEPVEPIDIIRTGLFGWDAKSDKWVEVSEI